MALLTLNTIAGATLHLVTFICQDATLKDCEIYTSAPMEPSACEAAALETGRRAKIYALPETIIFYCAEDLDDLPISTM